MKTIYVIGDNHNDRYGVDVKFATLSKELAEKFIKAVQGIEGPRHNLEIIEVGFESHYVEVEGRCTSCDERTVKGVVWSDGKNIFVDAVCTQCERIATFYPIQKMPKSMFKEIEKKKSDEDL